jgi:hypothetical protein
VALPDSDSVDILASIADQDSSLHGHDTFPGKSAI